MKTYTSPTIEVYRVAIAALLDGSVPEVTVTSDEMDGTEEQYFGAKTTGSNNSEWE